MDNIGVLVTLTLDNKQFNTELNKASEGLEQIRKNGLGLSQNLGSGKTGATTSMQMLVSGAKKFAGALLTVRGIWFGIRKSMSVYMAQNEELSDKLQSFWYGVGSVFAPLAEILIDTLGKALGYFDVFLKSLGFAGVDMSNLNKNAKETQKTLAGFDEINNLSDNTKQIANILDGVVLNESIVKVISDVGVSIRKLIPNTDNLDTKGFGTLATGLIAAALGGRIGSELGNGLLGSIAGISIGLMLTGEFDIDKPNTLLSLGVVVTGIKTLLNTNLPYFFKTYLGITKIATTGISSCLMTFAAGLGITWGINSIFNNLLDLTGLSETIKDIMKTIIGALEIGFGVWLIMSGNPALMALGVGIALAGVIQIKWGFENIFDKNDKTELPSSVIDAEESLIKETSSGYVAKKVTGQLAYDQYSDNASGYTYQASNYGASSVGASINGTDGGNVDNNENVVNAINQVIDAIREKANATKVVISQDSIGKSSENYQNRQARIMGVAR